MSIETAIYEVLSLTDLRPNARTNSVLTQLVNTVVETKDSSELNRYKKKLIEKVRNISASAETKMEIYWSRRISQSEKPENEMWNFPYIDNYVELTRRELSLVSLSGLTLNRNSKILVIGSGPLPLSAIELNRQTGAKISQVDNSTLAIESSRILCNAVGAKSGYYEGDGQNIHLDESYDLILIAALAGNTTRDKQKIIDNVLPHLSRNGRIILRSARDMRELLYPGIKADSLKRVKKLVEYHPQDYVINSVYIYGGTDEK